MASNHLSNINRLRDLQIRRALTLIWQSGPGWAFARIVLLVIQGFLPLIAIYLMKLVIDAVAAGVATSAKTGIIQHVALLIGLVGAVALLHAILRSISELVNETQAQMVTDNMFDILHAKSLEVDLEYYENAQYHDTLHRAQHEAPFRPTRILNNLVQLGQNSVALVAITGLLLSFSWIIVLILLLAAIPNVVVRLKYSNQLYQWQRKRTPLGRLASYFNIMLTRDRHAKEIRLFDLGTLFRERFRDLRRQLLKEKLRIITKRSIYISLTQFVSTVLIFSAFCFIAIQTIHGGFTIGDLGMFFMAFYRGQLSLQQMLTGLTGLYENNLFLTNLYEFLDIKSKIKEPRHPQPVPFPIQKGIIFDHVNFTYPQGKRPVLEDIYITIRPGEHIALVGENGSGKTTLVKLLCRLYDPTNGRITIDGADLRQFATKKLRRQISVVFQDYAKYHLTARENIWLGNIDITTDDKKIIEAARQTGAEDFINQLPYRYDTMLGKWFEDGEELSIGEWQKMALARAFLRDSEIIILDEPTSALDPKAEYALYQKFHEITAGKSAILISHRLSTVKMADQIYVIDNGSIIEEGTHNELILRNGKYAHLFNLQAQHYR